MITVVQRVREAHVRVADDVVGQIGTGLLLLVGVARGDTEADADATARKVAALRMFAGAKPMDLTVREAGGACLVVSQFTLVGRLYKGNRPSFDAAEDPPRAAALYERIVAQLREAGLQVQTGRFAADMQVSLVNDGPVTFIVETAAGALVKR
ncbi:MAG: D-tyrosyl-tRNA(Tyr) deacylase [Myxococcales bacterium]|nr:D-tyrosyl-tRNA(Tyr) deacylase [Myxococcales bacterium]